MSDVKLTAQIFSLYAGQRAEFPGNIRSEIISAFGYGKDVIVCTTGLPGWPQNGFYPHYAQGADVKPILRPLSSMTEEEAMEVYKIVYGEAYDGPDGDCRYHIGMGYKNGVSLALAVVGFRDTLGHPPAFLHLCSLGFDLFGLIDAGLAIDSTKYESHGN